MNILKTKVWFEAEETWKDRWGLEPNKTQT